MPLAAPLAAVLAQVSDRTGVAVRDQTGTLVHVNEWVAQYYGVRVSERFTLDQWSRWVHPDWQDRVIAATMRAVLGGHPYAWTAPTRRNDGVYRMLAVQGIPLDKGLTLSIGVDITETMPPVVTPRETAATMLGPQGAARMLGVSLPTLYRLVRAGRIPYTRVSPRLLRFDATKLRGWPNA